LDDVGTTSTIVLGIALLIGAVTAFLRCGWAFAFLLAALASQAFFYIEFGWPSRAAEMLFPLAYSAVPALLGSVVGVLASKKRGAS
jgi:high-affinity Fe2+/Pb2+ permease